MNTRILAALFILSPLLIFTGLPYPQSLPRTLLLITLGCVALVMALFKKKAAPAPLSLTYNTAAFFSFFIFLCFTTLIHPDAARGIFSSLERGTGILLFAACIALYPILKSAFSTHAVFFERISAIAVILMSAIGFLQKMFPGFLETFSGARVGGTLGNAIFFGMYLSLSAFFMAMLWIKTRNPLFLVALSGSLLALLFTATSGPLIGLFAGACVMFFIIMQKKFARATPMIALLLIIGALLSIFIFREPLLARLPTVQSRLVNWSIAWHGFLDHPIIGNGWETYHDTLSAHFDARLIHFGGAETYPDKPHNAYMELLQSTGACGTLLYLLWIAALFFSLHHLYKTKQISVLLYASSAGFLTTYLVQNFSAFETHGTIIPFTIFLAWIGTYNRPQFFIRVPAYLPRSIRISATTIFLGATWIGIIIPFPAMVALHTSDTATLLTALDSPYREEFLSALPSAPPATVKNVIAAYKIKTPWDKLLIAKYVSTAALATHDLDLLHTAQDNVTAAIQSNPRRQELFVIAGQLALVTQDLPAANAALQQAVALEPTQSEPHLLLAIILFAQNNIPDGWNELLQAQTNGLTTAPKNSLLFIAQKLQAAHENAKLTTLETEFTPQ